MNSNKLTKKSVAEKKSHLTMEVLNAIAEDARLSQRGLSTRLNVALGLTNGYLKRCVRKGLVKVQKIPPNRFAYYLTPQGFAEKAKLTTNYLYNSFRFYRRARNQCDGILSAAADRGYRRIAISGAGEMAEIALLCAIQHDVNIIGVADSRAHANRFRHVPLAHDLTSLEEFDAVLLCDVVNSQAKYETLLLYYPDDKILVPPLLNIITSGNSFGGSH